MKEILRKASLEKFEVVYLKTLLMGVLKDILRKSIEESQNSGALST